MVDHPSAVPAQSAHTTIPHWYSPGVDTIDIVSGRGSVVEDADGQSYLDFVSQLYSVNAGHGNDQIIEAMQSQLEEIAYVSPASRNPTRSRLAGELRDIAPGDLNNVIFSISGSEANELAVQIAREYQDAPKILTRWRSYHGGTYGTGALTGDPGTRNAIERYAATTGVVKFAPPLPHRAPFPATAPSELAAQATAHLEFVIQNEGPDSIAALLTEPLGGTSGAYPAPPGYFARVRELCDKYDILLIADEVITGFGRCGEWFGMETEGVVPDIITFAKGSTSAYAPLGGVITRADIADDIHENGLPVGQTFAGHPVSCAAAIGAMETYRDGLMDAVGELAPHLEGELSKLEARFDQIGSIHGRGFLWSIEFTDPNTGDPFLHPWIESGDNPVAAVRREALNRGLMVGAGRPDIQLIIAPPFCTSKAEIDNAIEILEEAISQVF